MSSVQVSFNEAKARRDNVAMIYVRAKKGRRIYYEGKILPEDKFVPVNTSPYIHRLVNHWKDLEVEKKTSAPLPANAG